MSKIGNHIVAAILLGVGGGIESFNPEWTKSVKSINKPFIPKPSRVRGKSRGKKKR